MKLEFRRYCGLENKMYDSIDIENDELGQLDGDNDQVYMLWTGLRDKNNKKIFIGDILITRNDNPEYDIWDENDYGITIVEEETETLGYKFSDWSVYSNDHQSCMSIRFVEVIGNIYENPELLLKY